MWTGKFMSMAEYWRSRESVCTSPPEAFVCEKRKEKNKKKKEREKQEGKGKRKGEE
jgi:hypothetical protein